MIKNVSKNASDQDERAGTYGRVKAQLNSLGKSAKFGAAPTIFRAIAPQKQICYTISQLKHRG